MSLVCSPPVTLIFVHGSLCLLNAWLPLICVASLHMRRATISIHNVFLQSHFIQAIGKYIRYTKVKVKGASAKWVRQTSKPQNFKGVSHRVIIFSKRSGVTPTLFAQLGIAGEIARHPFRGHGASLAQAQVQKVPAVSCGQPRLRWLLYIECGRGSNRGT